jgi:hypothetical protein
LNLVTAKGLDRQAGKALQNAVEVAGSLSHLRHTSAEYMEFLYVLAWFMGGSLEATDALLTAVPDATTSEHRVYWLRGKTIGCLVVGAHQGPEGDNDQKLKVTGHIVPISDVTRFELLDVQIDWPGFSGGERIPDLSPAVKLQFRDGTGLVIDVADRTNEAARNQAATFIDRLQAALAGGEGLTRT